MDKDIPSSRNVWRGESKDYWVTGGEWNTEYGASYEIGIREKNGNQNFTLVQGPWNEEQIKTVGLAVVALLDAGFGPKTIQWDILRS